MTVDADVQQAQQSLDQSVILVAEQVSYSRREVGRMVPATRPVGEGCQLAQDSNDVACDKAHFLLFLG